jgi:hypothetical protein
MPAAFLANKWLQEVLTFTFCIAPFGLVTAHITKFSSSRKGFTKGITGSHICWADRYC